MPPPNDRDRASDIRRLEIPDPHAPALHGGKHPLSGSGRARARGKLSENGTKIVLGLISAVTIVVPAVLAASPRARLWVGMGGPADPALENVVKKELNDHERLEDIDRRLSKIEERTEGTQKQVDAIFGAVVGRRVDPSMPERRPAEGPTPAPRVP